MRNSVLEQGAVQIGAGWSRAGLHCSQAFELHLELVVLAARAGQRFESEAVVIRRLDAGNRQAGPAQDLTLRAAQGELQLPVSGRERLQVEKDGLQAVIARHECLADRSTGLQGVAFQMRYLVAPDQG